MKALNFLALLLLMCACSPSETNVINQENSKETAEEAPVFDQRFAEARTAAAEQIRLAFEQREEGMRYRAMGIDLYSSVLLPQLYVDQAFTPLWFRGADSLALVMDMVDFLENVAHHGLVPEHYHFTEIKEQIDALGIDKEWLYDPYLLAHTDLLLTDAYFMLAAHLYHGKVNPESLKAQWDIRRNKPDLNLDKKLIKMLNSSDIQTGFSLFYPELGGYSQLIEEAKRLKPLENEDFQVSIPTKALSVKPGDSAAYIADVKKKLAFLGYYVPDTSVHPFVFDESTVKAVQKLQKQHGLNADGAIGNFTLRALNMPIKQMLDQLYVNMERLRWKPDSLEPEFVFVNIADQSLKFIKRGDTVSTMRVIVGKNYRETPVFNSTITYLVMSPTWTVPPGIQRNDIIPAVRKNIGYLAEKNMQVLNAQGKAVDPKTVDWSRDGMRYTIRQAPGSNNALGKVKFMFPNKYNVYLHDTPSRELFARDERTFSSGCIRIEKPLELASLLLADMPDWTQERIQQAMNGKSERTVVLKSPVGVYLYYLTAWGATDGQVHFRNDIYSRDAEMRAPLLDQHKGWRNN